MREPLLRRRGTSDHLSGMAASTEDGSRSQRGSVEGDGAKEEPSPLPSQTGSTADLQASASGLRPAASARRLQPPSGPAGAGVSRQGSVVNFSGRVATHCLIQLILCRPRPLLQFFKQL